ncbi:MAG: septum formation initiator family protein [Candidatus Curtissbacteria bacterium]|nr:septum formation initiator family protein [Candidatus Curtissbacteria bacterium]
MKRNLILIFAVLFMLILVFNGAKRLLALRTNSQEVTEAEVRLEELSRENENLQRELEYKKTERFAEEEIRNKLGLAKEGEVIVVLPKEEEKKQINLQQGQNDPNWKKWWSLFFEG